MRKLRTDGESLDLAQGLETLCERLKRVPGLAALYLYGSYGTRYQTPLSDVDLAVLFAPDSAPDLEEELKLRGLVTDSLREDDVSVVVLNGAPLAFQFKVISEGRRLLVTDELADADFRERTAQRFGDYALDFAVFADEYDRALREELLDGAG